MNLQEKYYLEELAKQINSWSGCKFNSKLVKECIDEAHKKSGIRIQQYMIKRGRV